MKEVTLAVENYFNNHSHISQQYSQTKQEVLKTRRLCKEV